MDLITLGKSDLRVSKLAFGCMSLGTDYKSNKTLLERAFNSGINFFDTADLYQNGKNEETLGKVFQRNRDKIIIATKVGNELSPDGKSWTWNPSKSYILKAVDNSLRRLQTDYIDLYQLHGGTIDDPYHETIDAFEMLVKAGKIRFYGISSIRPNVIQTYVKHSNIVSVMLQYSLLDRRPEPSILNLLHDHSIGVLARGPIAKGLLANKEPKHYLDYSKQDVQNLKLVLNRLSKESRTSAQIALKFVSDQEAVTSVVAGIRTKQQLTENVGFLKMNPLSFREKDLLTNVLPKLSYKLHL